MDAYRSADWAAFRAEVISLDGGLCTSCGRGPSDGVVLQVHHKQYFPGRKPWQYPHHMCETVCRGCHAARHGKIPPKIGWDFVGWNDLGELAGTCDCCGTSVRYLFLVTHPDWPTMEVGETCCDNLTSTKLASNQMESSRRFAARLKRFVSSVRWSNRPGGISRITALKAVVDVIPASRSFMIRVNGRTGRKEFATVLDAKTGVFEMIDSGELKAYLRRQDGDAPTG